MFTIIKEGIIIEIVNSIEEAKKIKNNDDTVFIIPFESHHKINLNVKEYVFKSNKELLENKEIELKNNEVLINDSIIQVNKNYKVENGQLVNKSLVQLYQENIINEEEYKNRFIKQREEEYKNKTDNLLIELLRKILIKNPNLLDDDDKKIFNLINEEIEKIKNNIPKLEEVKKWIMIIKKYKYL